METVIKLKDWIVFEDEDVIAINKPSGLLSIPDREGKDISLKRVLQNNYPSIFTVHRLDRDTSGLIIFAKNEIAHKHFSAQFEARQTEKIYQGLVIGSLSNKQGSIDSPIAEHPAKLGLMVTNRKGKESLTDYEVLNDYKIYSWLQFRIHTGRTHQIRVHMKEIGHPIVKDDLYGDGKPLLLSSIKSKFNLSKNELEERPLLARLALHALKLNIQSVNGNMLQFEAAIPKDIRATLQQLEKWKAKKVSS